jgi:FkbM family methyltransferase
LDIGARLGDYGTLLRIHNYEGHIISFEPVEDNFRQLQQRKANDPQWHIYKYALGSRNESIEINVSRDTNYSSFLPPSSYGTENHPDIAVERSEIVQVRRLDTIFNEVTAHIEQPRVFLKIDTQGWDLEVFRGARDCLERVVALQSELSLQGIYEDTPNWIEALSELQRANFEVSALFGISRDRNFRLTELDCVMVRNQ